MSDNFYLYVQTETEELFLSNNDEAPTWKHISDLGEIRPKCYGTLDDANRAMRCLVKPFATAITEVRYWRNNNE